MSKKVSETEDRISELQGSLKTLVSENEEIVATAKMEGKTLVIDEERRVTFQKNLTDANEIKSLLSDLEGFKDLGNWAHGAKGRSEAIAAGAAPVHAESKSVGQMFLDSEEFKNRRSSGGTDSFFLEGGDLSGRMIEGKDVYSSIPTGPIGPFGSTQRAPMVNAPERPGRVRDLFPRVIPTTSTTIEYFRETGFTNAAAFVAERTGDNTGFQAKPKSDIAIVSEAASVRTLAHWIAAHRNTLADEPVLQGFIDTKLLYGLRLVEDDQILNGNGTGQNLRGILTTPGIQSYNHPQDAPNFVLDSDPAVAGNQSTYTDNKVDAFRRAATLAYLAFYQPNGVVVHPNDWEEMELTKDANGQYLLAVSIALGGEPRVWRMRVVDTPAIAENRGLVGSFGLGCTLYDREQSNIRIAEQHASFFVENAVAILAEERVALTVERPESFVSVDLTTAT